MTGTLSVKKVRLDPDAQGAPLPAPFTTPLLTNSDLASTSARIGLSHGRATQGRPLMQKYDLAFTQFWQGGTRTYSSIEAGADLRLALGKTRAVSGNLDVERRNYVNGRKAQIVTLGSEMAFLLPDRSQIRAGLQVRHTDGPVFTSRSASAQINYALGEPIKSVQLSTSVGGSYTDYPDFSVGFITVPGGRQDESVFAQIDATFNAAEYVGFSPTLRLRHTSTDSNVSRFSGSELALSIGFESRF